MVPVGRGRDDDLERRVHQLVFDEAGLVRRATMLVAVGSAIQCA